MKGFSGLDNILKVFMNDLIYSCLPIKIVQVFLYFYSFSYKAWGLWKVDARIMVWLNQMRCLELKECLDMFDLIRWLWYR